MVVKARHDIFFAPTIQIPEWYVGSGKNGIKVLQKQPCVRVLIYCRVDPFCMASAVQPKCAVLRVIFRQQDTRPMWPEYGLQLYLNLSKSVFI